MGTREGDMNVRGELARPLSEERLDILSEAAGFRVHDRKYGAFGLGGRSVSLEGGAMPREQLDDILKKIETVPFVKFASYNAPTYIDDPKPGKSFGDGDYYADNE